MADPVPSTATVLGIPFFQGDCADAVRIAADGGLTVAPSGPGLARDLPEDPGYARAVREADLVLVDSGYLACLCLLLRGQKLRRISGLAFLVKYLSEKSGELARPGACLWVMPSVDEAEVNARWLATQGIAIRPGDAYTAPRYPRDKVEDPVLLDLVRERKPRHVFINIGGGIQEKLGWWLRENLALTPPPALICTGAAIAFLSGAQARIPPWADRLYLGWLLRILRSPRTFLPRYLKALRLPLLLLREHRADTVNDR